MQVSIIMPYYNAAAYIRETVKAVIAQTYKDWELIIIDDCSSAPETSEVLESVKSMDGRIIILRAEKNGGPALARNIGIEAAQGRHIAFCDSDDWWYPTKLEEQLKFMQDNSYEFTCTWYEDANEKLEPYYMMKQPPRQSFRDLMLKGNNLGTPGVIFDTQRIGKKFMPPLRSAEDWGLWMTILRDVDYIYTYPKTLWKYRHMSGSQSSNKWKMLKGMIKVYETVVGLSAIKAWGIALFVFLPNNMIKKMKKIFG